MYVSEAEWREREGSRSRRRKQLRGKEERKPWGRTGMEHAQPPPARSGRGGTRQGEARSILCLGTSTHLEAPPLLLGCPRIWAWLQELGCGVWTGREAGWGLRAESVARTACCGCVAPGRFWGHPLGSNQVGPDPPISPPNPISPSNGARLAFVPAVQQGWSITLTAIPKPTLRPR